MAGFRRVANPRQQIGNGISLHSLFWALLPAGLHHAGNFPFQGVPAEADAAHLKFTQVAARAPAQAAAVANANLELRLLAHLGKLRISRHRFSSNSFRYRPARAAARPGASKVRGLLRRSWPSSSG